MSKAGRYSSMTIHYLDTRLDTISNLLNAGQASEISVDDIQYLLDLIDRQAKQIGVLREEVHTYGSLLYGQ